MSWAVGWDSNWKRDVGYGVPATCDHPGCGKEIDRGLSYVCGGESYGGLHGCGLYFCSRHRTVAGTRRNYAPLCSRCYYGKEAFEPTPDRQEWVLHKLTDPSWEPWRQRHAAEVKRMEAQMVSHAELETGVGQ